MRLEKITVSQVRARIKKLSEGETFKVGLLPNKANPHSVWISPTFVEVSSIEKLEEYINNYSYYNCNNELGKRVAYWVEEK